MSSEVQTMADLGDDQMPRALQTPLYPIISLFGLLMIIGTFLPWAGGSNPDDSSISSSVSGLEAGGWGLSAIIVGVVIMALGVLGYFWNPFSDPEAMVIAGFAVAAGLAALIKIADPVSLYNGDPLVDYFDAGPRIGLWLVLLAALLSLVAALWILFSRPIAESRL